MIMSAIIGMQTTDAMFVFLAFGQMELSSTTKLLILTRSRTTWAIIIRNLLVDTAENGLLA